MITKNVQEVYENILNLFTGKDDARIWMKLPFLVGQKAVATNGTMLVALPKFNERYEDRSDKTLTVYPLEHNRNIDISIVKIKEAILTVPLIDCFDETIQKCAACEGEGEVDFDFGYGGKHYETLAECPVCDGDGSSYKTSEVPNGKKEIDYSKLIQIGDCVFGIDILENLIKISELLQSDTITLINQSGKYKANLFAIKDAEILAMPSMMSDDEIVCSTVL